MKGRVKEGRGRRKKRVLLAYSVRSRTTHSTGTWIVIYVALLLIGSDNVFNKVPINASCRQTVGDSLGIFPIAYLDRYLHAAQGGGATLTSSDLEVAVHTASQYTSNYTYQLPDGTISRTGGCCGSGGGSIYIWASGI